MTKGFYFFREKRRPTGFRGPLPDRTVFEGFRLLLFFSKRKAGHPAHTIPE